MNSNIIAMHIFCLMLLFMKSTLSQSFNPSILQDSRDLPKTDGTFGFLYRTEDGIAHAAKGDSDGVIHGRFTYTDPTGLKVNFNYNAGSRATPGYTDNESVKSAPSNPQPAQDYDEDVQQYKPRPRRIKPNLRRNQVYDDYN